MADFSSQDKLAAIQREIGYRRRVYARRVAVASQGIDVRISEGDAMAYADYHCPGGDASGAINLSDVAKRLADVMAKTS